MWKSMITWFFGLILVYLLATNGKNVQGLIQSGGAFVTTETKTLQGR